MIVENFDLLKIISHLDIPGKMLFLCFLSKIFTGVEEAGFLSPPNTILIFLHPCIASFLSYSWFCKNYATWTDFSVCVYTCICHSPFLCLETMQMSLKAVMAILKTF